MLPPKQWWFKQQKQTWTGLTGLQGFSINLSPILTLRFNRQIWQWRLAQGSMSISHGVVMIPSSHTVLIAGAQLGVTSETVQGRWFKFGAGKEAEILFANLSSNLWKSSWIISSSLKIIKGRCFFLVGSFHACLSQKHASGLDHLNFGGNNSCHFLWAPSSHEG